MCAGAQRGVRPMGNNKVLGRIAFFNGLDGESIELFHNR